ncbi:hypothetical protein [Paenibacillus xylanexedens]|uniref:hypothetical protein n=1 Tax=Paenibacillus xylanexedens TaxID=528191 RepID=UPI00164235EB|nr:hypothetical protein [Paenibacillus xylanexedens]
MRDGERRGRSMGIGEVRVIGIGRGRRSVRSYVGEMEKVLEDEGGIRYEVR